MNYQSIAITYILYLLFILGLLLIFRNAFLNLYARITLRYRLYDKRNDGKEFILFSYLSRLVYTLYGKEKKGKLLFFLLIILFSLTFSFSYIYFRFLISIMLAALCTSIPVLSLVSKLIKERNRSSREGQSFLSEMYRNYRIENKNIFTAIEKTVEQKDSFPLCAKHASLLLLKLRSSGNRENIKEACRGFSYAIGSSWARNLSLCIYYAFDGIDVSDALLDLISQLKNSRKNYEIRKRLNSESLRMTVYLVPILYFAGFAAGNRYLGISFTKMIYNQFRTPEGLLFFFVIILLFAFNVLAQNFVAERKIDI